MKNFSEVANSQTFLLIVSVPIILVLCQAVLFARLSVKRMKELGLGKDVKKVIANSAIFSIIPSLPIVIGMAALSISLGSFLPWLRLSVIGSTMYETICADMALQGFGQKFGVTEYAPDIFVSIVYVMSIVALAWPLCNLVGLRFYDKKLKSLQQTGGFIKPATVAMFIGLMCYFAVPYFFHFTREIGGKTVGNPTGIIVSIFSGGSVLLYDWLAQKTKIRVLGDFAFPLAMVTGMVSAIVWTSITT